MTQRIISLEEAKELAKPKLAWWSERGFSARVMGGFVRDAVMGVPFKDMDIYLDHIGMEQGKWDMDKITELAKEFYDRHGHEFILHKVKKVANATEESPYHEFLTVFQSTKVPEGRFPIDLIFSPQGYSHPGQFDLALCEQTLLFNTWDRREVIYRATNYAKRDMEHKTITVHDVVDSLFQAVRGYEPLTEEQLEKACKRVMDHLDRVKEKYPEFTVVRDLNRYRSRDLETLYEKLMEAGYFGEAREILPTEAGIAEGDAVRQLDREELVRIVRGEGQRAGIQTWDDLVFDPPQVPPGLQPRHADFGFLERLVAERIANTGFQANPGRG